MPQIRRIYNIRIELFKQYTRIGVLRFDRNKEPRPINNQPELKEAYRKKMAKGEAISRRNFFSIDFSIDPAQKEKEIHV
jgi:hypothetical protein